MIKLLGLATGIALFALLYSSWQNPKQAEAWVGHGSRVLKNGVEQVASLKRQVEDLPVYQQTKQKFEQAKWPNIDASSALADADTNDSAKTEKPVPDETRLGGSEIEPAQPLQQASIEPAQPKDPPQQASNEPAPPIGNGSSPSLQPPSHPTEVYQYAFWQPFSNATSAEGFARYLRDQTGLALSSRKSASGGFEVVLEYSDPEQLQPALQKLRAFTGAIAEVQHESP